MRAVEHRGHVRFVVYRPVSGICSAGVPRLQPPGMADGEGSGSPRKRVAGLPAGRKMVSFPDCPHGRERGLHPAVAELPAGAQVAVGGAVSDSGRSAPIRRLSGWASSVCGEGSEPPDALPPPATPGARGMPNAPTEHCLECRLLARDSEVRIPIGQCRIRNSPRVGHLRLTSG